MSLFSTLQAAGLTITDSQVRVEIDRRSGEVVELSGTLPNLTELGEYSVISVEQALEKLWQAKMPEPQSSQLNLSG